MSRGPTLSEILVSQLGTPKEPFDLGVVLVGFVLVLGLAGYLAVEYGLARLLMRLFRRK